MVVASAVYSVTVPLRVTVVDTIVPSPHPANAAKAIQVQGSLRFMV